MDCAFPATKSVFVGEVVVRAVVLTALLASACSPPATTGKSEVDLNGAADRAQGDIQSYNANPGDNQAAAPRPYGPGEVEPPKVTTARYRCMDGSKMSVRIDHDTETAVVTRDGVALPPLHQPAKWGDRYVGRGYEFRFDLKTDAATMTRPGQPPVACTIIR